MDGHENTPISLNELIDALHHNQEVEFSLSGYPFFATPRTDPPLPRKYAILDVNNKRWVVEGEISEILSYPLNDGKTILNCASELIIEYIL